MADFDAPFLTMVGIAEFNLPGHDIRLVDGGFLYWNDNKFASEDEEFGTIQSVEILEERAGDEAPSGKLTFLPQSTADAATLSQPSYQGSRLRFWLGRVDEQSGELEGEPELLFDGMLDTTTLRIARGRRALDMEYITTAERLFLVNDGNVLSPRFHKSVWPGETGLDNATGVPLTKAFGVAGPPRGSSVGGSSGGGGFGGGSDFLNHVQMMHAQ